MRGWVLMAVGGPEHSGGRRGASLRQKQRRSVGVPLLQLVAVRAPLRLHHLAISPPPPPPHPRLLASPSPCRRGGQSTRCKASVCCVYPSRPRVLCVSFPTTRRKSSPRPGRPGVLEASAGVGQGVRLAPSTRAGCRYPWGQRGLASSGCLRACWCRHVSVLVSVLNIYLLMLSNLAILYGFDGRSLALSCMCARASLPDSFAD